MEFSGQATQVNCALRVAPLAIASLEAFWFFERLAGFLT